MSGFEQESGVYRLTVEIERSNEAMTGHGETEVGAAEVLIGVSVSTGQRCGKVRVDMEVPAVQEAPMLIKSTVSECCSQVTENSTGGNFPKLTLQIIT